MRTIKEWTVVQDEKCIHYLQPYIGKRVTLAKVGSKFQGLIERFRPEFVISGILSLIDRGGGPAAYFATTSEWFATSQIIKATNTDAGIELETENSVYLVKPWN